MGSLKINVSLDVSGALADGRAADAIGKWQERTTQALADKGVEILAEVPMNKSGRSTGTFRSSLHEIRKDPSWMTVPGMRVRGEVWAPWLEGATQRNRSTRFLGYHLFAKTRAELDNLATEIGQRELDAVIEEMGGQ